MFAGKPVIGIVGGIGSGKSFVATLLGELGAKVISSDEQVHRAYADEEIQRTLRQWWGPAVFHESGQLNRSAVAREVFNDADQRKRLEALIHPIVARERDQIMQQTASDPTVKAFVWDTPLLFETGLDRQCDVIVFVEAPKDLRLARLAQSRGWDKQELEKREKFQLLLDKKRQMAHYTVVNTADAAQARRQVSQVFSRILTTATKGSA
jgi:dephospho-CoA kinase